MSQERNILFRPNTRPILKRDRSKSRRKEFSTQLSELDIIRRPQQRFFELIFQKNTYLWVIVNGLIKTSTNIQTVDLYERMKACFLLTGLDENNMPICTSSNDLKRWIKTQQCKLVIDENMHNEFDQILNEKNVISANVVITSNNITVVKKIRNSETYFHKIKSIEDNYDHILEVVKEDMQKVKVLEESQKIEKIKLPNFMKLRLKDKSEIIAYRNNIYCLTNLHHKRSDLEVSRKRFVEQCEKSYTNYKDRQSLKYYLSYPFNHREVLRFYTEDTFFYKCLNNTLRVAKTTEQFFIIGEPFNRMFRAIKNLYKEQFPISKSRKNLKVYRGADLSPSESEYLQKSIGGYIEIHGFVSTSTNIQTAQKFAIERKHNKIIEIIFDQNTCDNQQILENDYGFVDLVDISRYQEDQILFNCLNIFKVMGKYQQGQFEYYQLKYGTIFNVLNIDTPQKLKHNDRIAYYTYKQLMGEKQKIEDIGVVFMLTNEPQKSVDYYETKIEQAKSQGKLEYTELIIKKAQALLMNGEPGKALQNMAMLIGQRKNIKKTNLGARFIQQIVNNKEQIVKEVDINSKYSIAGQSLDKFSEAQSTLVSTDEALADVLQKYAVWDFDLAYKQVEVKMQLASFKESQQLYHEMYELLVKAEELLDEIEAKVEKTDVSFNDLKKVYMEKTLIYQMMARQSIYLEGQNVIDIGKLDKKFQAVEAKLISLIEEGSYEKSLIEIRKIEVARRKQDFNLEKKKMIQKVEKSLISIKLTSLKDSQVPKAYHMLGDIQKQSGTLSSTNSAISYFEKEFIIQTNYYGQHDPRTIKTVIDIAECHRDKKDAKESVILLKQQLKIVPFKIKPKHTIVTKTLYTMGLAYIDLGEYTYALKCFQKGLIMLKQNLNKQQLSNYHHKYKIEMQLGRTYTFLTRYQQAEKNLSSYHQFVLKLHNKHHSDIAKSLNLFGILYLKLEAQQKQQRGKVQKLKKSKQYFEESSEMFQITGIKSLLCGKIKCNLGMIYAVFKQKNRALEMIDQANRIFNELFNKQLRQNSSVHSQSYLIYFYYAEISKMFKEYKEAIGYYEKSRQKLNEYNYQKKEANKNQSYHTSKFESQFVRSASVLLNKRENHEINCTVKILECKIKLDEPKTQELGQKILRDIQKQINSYNQYEDAKESDINSVSQLNKLLEQTKKLMGKIQKSNIRKSKFKADQPQNSKIQNREILAENIQKVLF